VSDYNLRSRIVEDYDAVMADFLARRRRALTEQVSRQYGLPLEFLEDQSHIERGEN
jgi:hypothetical protein